MPFTAALGSDCRFPQQKVLDGHVTTVSDLTSVPQVVVRLLGGNSF